MESNQVIEVAVEEASQHEIDARVECVPVIDSVILKIVSPCNLNCTYCYVYNHEDQGWRTRPKTIPDEVYDATLATLLEHADAHDHKVSIIFHGGEPLLIGKERFEKLVHRAREYLGDRLETLGMQSNGTLIDAEWVELFSRLEIHPGISLDGPKEIHDASRIDHQGRGSHTNTVRGLQMLTDAGLPTSVLCVINPGMSGASAYRYFRSLGIINVDFLIPDVNHDNKERFYGELGPTPVADFLLEVFELWYADDDDEVRIRVLWDMISRVVGGSGSSDIFGNPPMCYIVVETDGSIEALDALRVCEEGIAKTGLNVMTDSLADIGRDNPLIHEMFSKGIDLCDTCKRCEFSGVCAGGYLPHRFSKSKGFDNPSVWCEDIKRIFTTINEVVANAEC